MGRFLIEYFRKLKTSKHKLPTTVSVGQIVLVRSDITKPIERHIAKILELYPRKNGNTRVARVNTG